MTITVDLTTQIGQVRLEIGDDDATTGHGKRPDGTNLSDAAITLWLTRAGTFQGTSDGQVMLAAAFACEQLARDWSTVSNVTAPSRSETAGDVAAKWAARAAELRKAVAGGQGLRVRSLRATPVTSEYGGASTTSGLDEWRRRESGYPAG